MATHSNMLAWKFHGQRSLVGYSQWGPKESDMTEHTCTKVIYTLIKPQQVRLWFNIFSEGQTFFHIISYWEFWRCSLHWDCEGLCRVLSHNPEMLRIVSKQVLLPSPCCKCKGRFLWYSPSSESSRVLINKTLKIWDSPTTGFSWRFYLRLSLTELQAIC